MAATTTRLVRVLALGLLLAAPPLARADALDPRLEAATQLYREEGAEKALPVFDQLASEFARGSRTHDQAAALHAACGAAWGAGQGFEGPARNRLWRQELGH